jgi:hypothetical protein
MADHRTAGLPAEKLPEGKPSGLSMLTPRERGMVYALIVVVAATALVFLLVLPQMGATQSLRDELALLDAHAARTQAAIAALPAIQQEHDAASGRYNEAIKSYLTPMRPEDLDAMITQLLIDSGFEPESLTSSQISADVVNAYVPAVLNPLPEGAETGDETETGGEPATGGGEAAVGEGAPENAQEGAAIPVSYTYTVGATASGSMENLYALIDAVAQRTGLKLAAYAYTPASRAAILPGGPSSGAGQPDAFSMTFKVYVYVKGGYEDIVPPEE